MGVVLIAESTEVFERCLREEMGTFGRADDALIGYMLNSDEDDFARTGAESHPLTKFCCKHKKRLTNKLLDYNTQIKQSVVLQSTCQKESRWACGSEGNIFVLCQQPFYRFCSFSFLYFVAFGDGFLRCLWRRGLHQPLLIKFTP